MRSQIPLGEKFVHVGGYKIRYIEKGKGAPLILIHGLGASLEWWQFNLDTLSQKYRVIVFDFLGFGFSSKPKINYSLDLASSFLCSFLDAFQIPKASLVGNSMGGLVALYTALMAPERVNKLILVNNAGFGSELSFFLRFGAAFPIGEFALAIRNHLTAKMLISQMFYDPKKIPSHLVDRVLKIFNLPRTGKTCLDVLRYGVGLKGLKEKIWLPIIKKASALPHATLIIWGADDRIIPVSQGFLGNRLIKSSQVHIIKKCGHVPHVEWPEKFNSLVLNFLDS